MTQAQAATIIKTNELVAPKAPEAQVTVAVNAPTLLALKNGAPMSGAELIQKTGSKSAAIRALAGAGHKTGPIAKCLGIRYQHARNVLSQPLKRPPVEKIDMVLVVDKVEAPKPVDVKADVVKPADSKPSSKNVK